MAFLLSFDTCYGYSSAPDPPSRCSRSTRFSSPDCNVPMDDIRSVANTTSFSEGGRVNIRRRESARRMVGEGFQ